MTSAKEMLELAEKIERAEFLYVRPGAVLSVDERKQIVAALNRRDDEAAVARERSEALNDPDVASLVDRLRIEAMPRADVEKLNGERREAAYIIERLCGKIDWLRVAPQNAVPADVREALKPFAEAAREFTSAIGPDGIDDGVAVVATMHGTRREAILSTTDFSRAAKVFAQRVVNQINSAIAQEAK